MKIKAAIIIIIIIFAAVVTITRTVTISEFLFSFQKESKYSGIYRVTPHIQQDLSTRDWLKQER